MIALYEIPSPVIPSSSEQAVAECHPLCTEQPAQNETTEAGTVRERKKNSARTKQMKMKTPQKKERGEKERRKKNARIRNAVTAAHN